MYAFAQSAAQEAAQGFLTKINEAILFPLITLMMAIALLIFLYGAFEYVKGAANDGDRETGRRHLLYGIIGMLVMLSAFTILTIAAATFGLDDELEDHSATQL
jgi:Na+/H+ antiporter NhaD/arsenite permease-like protein